jgi:hypothetical protein
MQMGKKTNLQLNYRLNIQRKFRKFNKNGERYEQD